MTQRNLTPAPECCLRATLPVDLTARTLSVAGTSYAALVALRDQVVAEVYERQEAEQFEAEIDALFATL